MLAYIYYYIHAQSFLHCLTSIIYIILHYITLIASSYITLFVVTQFCSPCGRAKKLALTKSYRAVLSLYLPPLQFRFSACSGQGVQPWTTACQKSALSGTAWNSRFLHAQMTRLGCKCWQALSCKKGELALDTAYSDEPDFLWNDGCKKGEGRWGGGGVHLTESACQFGREAEVLGHIVQQDAPAGVRCHSNNLTAFQEDCLHCPRSTLVPWLWSALLLSRALQNQHPIPLLTSISHFTSPLHNAIDRNFPLLG